jgi:hypothetical protein
MHTRLAAVMASMPPTAQPPTAACSVPAISDGTATGSVFEALPSDLGCCHPV